MAEAIQRHFVDDPYALSGSRLATHRQRHAASVQTEGAAAVASFDVLDLSGGTDLGAWGTGFMAGWRQAGSLAKVTRPNFDMVVGVSAGALMATHSFLGMDEEIDHAFKTTGDGDLFRKRFWLEWIWSDALLDDRKKDSMQARFLTEQLIQRVADEGDKGRSLYVGVVNMVDGRFRYVDMVGLASLGDLALRLASYRAVIGGATALPVAMPHKAVGPRCLLADGAMHRPLAIPPRLDSVPSGVRRRLFVLAQQLAAVDDESYPHAGSHKIVDAATRTMAVASASLMDSSLRLLHETAQRTAPDGQLLFETWYAGVPSATKACAGARRKCPAGELFCKPYMQCLSQHGRSLAGSYAAGVEPWPTTPWDVPGLLPG